MHETTQETVPDPPARRSRLGLVRFSAVELLIALVLLFVAAPFIEDLKWGSLIELLLTTLVMVSAVLAVGGRRRTLLITTVLVIPVLFGKWIHHLWPGLFPPAVSLSCGVVFIAFIIVHLLRFVLRTPRVNGEVLCASVSAYLMLGLVWSLAYRIVADLIPGAFTFSGPHEPSMQGFNAFYFSFVTLTTVGYGDITPAANVARMLAVMESMTGTLYVAVLIARLVALYSAPEPSIQPSNSDQPRP